MAKKFNVKIPKRIAGVKIPKGIRKGPIADFLNSSGGQVVMGEALLAFAAYYAARRWEPNTAAGELLRHPIDSMRTRLGDERGLTSAPDRVGRACRAAIQAFRGALNDSRSGAGAVVEPVSADATTANEAAEGGVPKKKASRSPNEAAGRDATSGPH
jgi:hypothetical protein